MGAVEEQWVWSKLPSLLREFSTREGRNHEGPQSSASIPEAMDCLDQISSWVQFASSASVLVVLMLDYDGTLTPIVEDPEAALMSEEMRAVLRSLCDAPWVLALVSGRSKAKLKQFVQLENIWYIGSHGFEMEGPNKETFEDSEVRDEAAHVGGCFGMTSFRQDIQLAAEDMHQRIQTISGASVEDNGLTVTLHYRKCSEQDLPRVEQVAEIVLGRFGDRLRRTRGKCVIELRPRVEWNKGTAIQWLLSRVHASSGSPLLPIYIGDDVTDEDAFLAIRNKGVNFLVASDSTVHPTHADYRLRNPDEVRDLLSCIGTCHPSRRDM